MWDLQGDDRHIPFQLSLEAPPQKGKIATSEKEKTFVQADSVKNMNRENQAIETAKFLNNT